MQIFQPGPVRIATLDGVGAKIKTLYLPAPDVKLPGLRWDRKLGGKWELINGSERERQLGFIPVLRLAWGTYDDRAGQGYTIGNANGQRPSAEQFLQLLSAASGTLKVSPGLTAGGFVVGSIDVSEVYLVGSTFVGGLTVTLRGRDIQSEQVLGSF